MIIDRETRLQAIAYEAKRRRTTYGKLMAQLSEDEQEEIAVRYAERRRRQERLLAEAERQEREARRAEREAKKKQ